MTAADVTDAAVLACFASPRVRMLVREITKEIALCMTRRQAPPTLETVLGVVSRHYGVKVAQMCGPGRVKALSRPRFVAMWMLRQLGLSYPQIAVALGRTDHSTAHSAVAVVEKTPHLLEDAKLLLAGLG